VAGLDGKVGLTNNMTVDLTVNPDFGQVEADPSVVNLTAFETYYAEKRPFFIEGARVFDMSITSLGYSSMDRLFYSRRIGRRPQVGTQLGAGEFADTPERTTILGAAKITGKTASGWSVGMLETVTGEELATIDHTGVRRFAAVEPLTNYFVSRLQRDYRHGQTTVGGLLTAVNREVDEPQFTTLGSAAYTGGFDVVHYWHDRAYYARGTAVFSHVRGSAEAIDRIQRASPRFMQRPDAGYLHYDPRRTSLSGSGGSIEGGRSGNSRFLINGSFAWRSPGLELSDVGFQLRADYTVSRVQVDHREFQPFWIFRRFNSSGAVWMNHLYSGERAGCGAYASVWAQLRNYWVLGSSYESDSEYLDVTALRGGPTMMVSAVSRLDASVQSDLRRRVSGNVAANWVSDPNHGQHHRSLSFGVLWRPTDAVSVSLRPYLEWNDPRLQYVTTTAAASGPRYVLAGLTQRTVSLTARVNYALTPTLTVQYYGQPFVSAGQYRDFKQVTDPRATTFDSRFRLLGSGQLTSASGRLSVDENGDGAQDYSFGDPNFSFRQFRSNLVVRWEYSPGSTLFVVWSQGRTGADASGAFSFRGGLDQLFYVRPENIFLVKFSRWFSW
jgi:hypothetical protein